jgi:hypothetical protein
MKTKKTLRRLNKVAALLSDVIDKLPDRKGGLGDVLDSAKANVVRAAKIVHSQPSKGSAKRKAPANAEGRVSAAGKKRISVAATKRSKAVKRKGVNSVSGRRLSKTA